MRRIESDSVINFGEKWYAICKCGQSSGFAAKAAALSMVSRGTCRYCRRDYRTTKNVEISIYKNDKGKWCKHCSGCGIEQAYTRMDHAKQSMLRDWQCKKCVQSARRFSNNAAVGAVRRMYNKFQKSAADRNLEWSVSVDYIDKIFTGRCDLTGWEISMDWADCTASLDRIDNSLGYVEGNVRWVHVMVNMCKNRYSDLDFFSMCKAIAANPKCNIF